MPAAKMQDHKIGQKCAHDQIHKRHPGQLVGQRTRQPAQFSKDGERLCVGAMPLCSEPEADDDTPEGGLGE